MAEEEKPYYPHQEEPEWMKEFYRKVIKNSGLTPGNDEYLTLECGHEMCVSVPHWTTYVYKVGEECLCTTCMDADNTEEEKEDAGKTEAKSSSPT